MIVFIDFEASSLGKRGFPIEVGWATEEGQEEGYLIRPAPGWEEWAADAEGIHGVSRARLLQEGTAHDAVARRMMDALAGHDLYASAPSWDGQWLSRLLRAAGLPRHALRLRDTEEAHQAAILAALDGAGVPVGARRELLDNILGAARGAAGLRPPAHRALDDARRELRLWHAIRCRAAEAAARWSG